VLPLKKTKRVDKWISYLTIYSNSENNGEQLNFKIWDASKGLILIANVDNKSSIPYEENGVLGRLSHRRFSKTLT
jgi:hypothetical protein